MPAGRQCTMHVLLMKISMSNYLFCKSRDNGSKSRTRLLFYACTEKMTVISLRWNDLKDRALETSRILFEFSYGVGFRGHIKLVIPALRKYIR